MPRLRGTRYALLKSAARGISLPSLSAGAGLAGWFEDDGVSWFSSDTGAVLASTGGTVGRIADLIAPATDLVQATAGSRPTLTAGGPGARRFLAHDGTDDYLGAAVAAAFSGSQNWAAVLCRFTNNVTRVILDMNTASALSRRNMTVDATGFIAIERDGAGGSFNLGLFPFSLWGLLIGEWNGASSRLEFGGWAETGTISTNTTNSVSPFNLFARLNGALPIQGSMAGFAYGNGALTAADRAALRTHFELNPDLGQKFLAYAPSDLTVDLGNISLIQGGESELILQLGINVTTGCYFRFPGDTTTLKTIGIFSITANNNNAPTGEYTAEEARHGGPTCFHTNNDNNYIAMISTEASAAGQRSFQLIKQVANVETIFGTVNVSGLTVNTKYRIEIWRDAGNLVQARLKTADGSTTLGSITSAVDTSLSSGNSGGHMSNCQAKCWAFWTEAI